MKLLRISGLILFLLCTIGFLGFKGIELNSQDILGPEITFEKDSIAVSVKDSNEKLLQDVTAFDEKDGDVTNSLLIENISRFTNTDKRTITYAAFDTSNNISKIERELVLLDYVPPRFSLSKPLRFYVGEEDNIISNMAALDCIDGDITDKIKYNEKTLGLGESEGTYKVEFQVTNSAGDTAYLPTTVEFYYPGYQNIDFIPVIELSEYLIYIKAGESVNFKSYIKDIIVRNVSSNEEEQMEVSNISKEEVEVTSNLNQNIPGVYDIKYSVTSKDGYDVGTTKLLVVVEE